MGSVNRQVWLAAGGDAVSSGDLDVSRVDFAPGAVDSAYQEVRFLRFERTDRTADAVLVEFDELRRETEPQIQMAGAFPVAFVSSFRADNAPLSRPDKFLVLANLKGNHASPALAKQMRRLLGLRGCTARRDVLVAAHLDAS